MMRWSEDSPVTITHSRASRGFSKILLAFLQDYVGQISPRDLLGQVMTESKRFESFGFFF